MPPLDIPHVEQPIIAHIEQVEQPPFHDMPALTAFLASVQVEREHGAAHAYRLLLAWHEAKKHKV